MWQPRASTSSVRAATGHTMDDNANDAWLSSLVLRYTRVQLFDAGRQLALVDIAAESTCPTNQPHNIRQPR